jgi:transcription antitermination protein NusB
MAARSKARKRAVDVLFEADQRGRDPMTVLADRLKQADPPVNEYTITLVEGVLSKRERIDELISTYAQGWTLDRMPSVDRNVLRLGVYEVLYVDDVPDAVAVSEAVALVRNLSTDDSPSFVNGVLGSLLRDRASLTL